MLDTCDKHDGDDDVIYSSSILNQRHLPVRAFDRLSSLGKSVAAFQRVISQPSGGLKEEWPVKGKLNYQMRETSTLY